MTKTASLTGDFSDVYDKYVPCPRCGSGDTRVTSPFGGTVSEMLFQCKACGDGFGWMKWEHRTSRTRELPTETDATGDNDE